MQIRYFLALCLLPQTVFAQTPAPEAESLALCVVEPPVSRSFDDREKLSGIQDTDIVIISDNSSAAFDDKAHFNGDVSFSQGSRHIAADEAILDQKKQQLSASGNLIFKDDQFTITATNLEAQMSSSSATLEGAEYWLHGQQAHGDAKK